VGAGDYKFNTKISLVYKTRKKTLASNPSKTEYKLSSAAELAGG